VRLCTRSADDDDDDDDDEWICRSRHKLSSDALSVRNGPSDVKQTLRELQITGQ